MDRNIIRNFLVALPPVAAAAVDSRQHKDPTVFGAVQPGGRTFARGWCTSGHAFRRNGVVDQKAPVAQLPCHEPARDPSKEVVVGYGSAKFAPGGKGEVSVPVCRAFKECCYRFRTLVVDEFWTTMVHHESDSILKLVRRKDNNSKLRDLLWCESTSPERKSKFVSRDFNAAINILRCLTLPIRPLALTRIPGQAALAYVTGKLVGFRRAAAC